MKILKNILNWFMLLVGAKSELTDEMVEECVEMACYYRTMFGGVEVVEA